MMSNTTAGVTAPAQRMLVAPDREREVHAVAQAVREEELRHAEASIPLVDAEHAARIVLGAHDHVVLEMHAALRVPRSARRIQPERRGVAAGRLRLEHGRRVGHELLEADRAAVVHVFAGDDDMAYGRTGPDGFVRFSVQRSAQDDDARRRVAEDVVVFRRGPSRVQGHRDGADLDGTEEGGNHLRQIEHQQQDTFFRPDAELVPEGVPRPVDLLLKFAIRQPAAVALDCNRFRSSFVDMAVDEVGSGVENRSGGARRAHGSRLYAPRSIRTGSTPAARHAGIRQASAPTARSSNGTPMNVNASWGATP